MGPKTGHSTWGEASQHKSDNYQTIQVYWLTLKALDLKIYFLNTSYNSQLYSSILHGFCWNGLCRFSFQNPPLLSTWVGEVTQAASCTPNGETSSPHFNVPRVITIPHFKINLNWKLLRTLMSLLLGEGHSYLWRPCISGGHVLLVHFHQQK